MQKDSFNKDKSDTPDKYVASPVTEKIRSYNKTPVENT